MINIDAIRPDPLGKYSPLLYKWLTSKRFRTARQVFQSGSVLDNSVFSDHWRPREIIIGTDYGDGFVGGRNLGDIISGARGAKSMGYAYSVRGFNLRDITAEFWQAYERVGRCAWDQGHSLYMIGDEQRWHYIDGGRQRECRWCGRLFEQHVTVEPVIEFKERTDWTDYRTSAPATLLHPMGSMGEAL